MEKEKEKFIDAILEQAKMMATKSGADLSTPKDVTITLQVQKSSEQDHIDKINHGGPHTGLVSIYIDGIRFTYWAPVHY
jgi:hypothetical protein